MGWTLSQIKVRYFAALIVITGLVLASTSAQTTLTQVPTFAVKSSEQYILVGGQNGTWFEPGQAPRLYRIFLLNYSVTSLGPLPLSGTVWSGSWNGSQWLISGWGSVIGPNASNPYIYLYDGQNQVIAGTQRLWTAQSSWHGGDVFAANYNGSEWLLSGLGSDWLPSGWASRSTGQLSNHMSLATFNGYNFTDLSGDVPNQWDAILFANAWNGHYWLIGGGWQGNEGVLYRYNGTNFIDLSSQLEYAMSQNDRGGQFHSVQAIEWNGDYWLVGGVGFLAKYDGLNFTDLTPDLNAVLEPRHALDFTSCCNAVNAIAWDGASWRLGGGAPVGTSEPLTAWAVSYDGKTFTDLTSIIPSYIARAPHGSSILSISYSDGSWFFGGYVNDRGLLFSLANSVVTDLSEMINGTVTTVNWVGALPATPHEAFSNPTSSFGNYVLVPIMIVLIASALAIKYGKRRRSSQSKSILNP